MSKIQQITEKILHETISVCRKIKFHFINTYLYFDSNSPLGGD